MLRARRAGVSLVELVVVLAVLGIAGGALVRLGRHQQQAYRSIASRALAIARLREGSEVLLAELAGVSPGAGDIYEGGMLRESVSFRLQLGTHVACRRPAAGSSDVDVVPLGALAVDADAGGSAAAALPPEAGDSVWVHDAGRDVDASDDSWRAHAVIAAAAVRVRCPPVGDSPDVPATRISLSPSPSGSIADHTPLRTFRRARYALYRSGDGDSYLGFSDCRPGVREPACAPLQPVSGPYLPAAPAAVQGGGLSFVYLDRDGLPTNDRMAVAAVELTLRAGSVVAGRFTDTLSVRRVVAFRNAPR